MTLRRDECEYHIPGSGIDLSQERLFVRNGPVFFDIVHPEMITLGIRIADVLPTDPLDLVQKGSVRQRRPTKFGPIPPSSAQDDIIDRGKGEVRMSQMSMFQPFLLSTVFHNSSVIRIGQKFLRHRPSPPSRT